MTRQCTSFLTFYDIHVATASPVALVPKPPQHPHGDFGVKRWLALII
jgi:hypothetical protein